MVNEIRNNIKYWISHTVVILGVIYLIFVPSGLIKKKFDPVDVGVLMVLLVANSDIIQRISQLKIGKDGVELSVEKVKKEIKEEVQKSIEDKEIKDSGILKTVDLLLSETTSLGIPPEELKEQIKNVTPVIAEYIYYRAKELRHKAWLDKKNRQPKRGLMERTILIFQALTESEYGNERHRFYAQLGYALKDQDSPDWEKAKDSLDTAIKFWEKENKKASLPPHYCFNWIICVVELSKLAKSNSNNFQQVHSNKKEICERIKAAASCESLREVLEKNQDLQNWLRQEGLENTLADSNGACRKERYEEDKQMIVNELNYTLSKSHN